MQKTGSGSLGKELAPWGAVASRVKCKRPRSLPSPFKVTLEAKNAQLEGVTDEVPCPHECCNWRLGGLGDDLLRTLPVVSDHSNLGSDSMDLAS